MPPLRLRRSVRIYLLGVAAAALLACDDQGPATPADIVVAPNLPRVPMGDTRQLRATVVDADGRAIDGEPVTFQSSDVSILTVDEAGLLTSVGPLGRSIVSVTSGDISTELEARVVVGPSALYVSPALLELRPGDRAQLHVVLTDENGDSIPSPDVLFSTDLPEVAQVSADASVTAVDLGAAVITVSGGGQSRLVDVAVSAP